MSPLVLVACVVVLDDNKQRLVLARLDLHRAASRMEAGMNPPQKLVGDGTGFCPEAGGPQGLHRFHTSVFGHLRLG